MWGVEESYSHSERVNTYRCNIYRGWTVIRSTIVSYLMKTGDELHLESVAYAALSDWPKSSRLGSQLFFFHHQIVFVELAFLVSVLQRSTHSSSSTATWVSGIAATTSSAVMGNWMAKEPPPPVVLVPPLFERPHLATRSRSRLITVFIRNS